MHDDLLSKNQTGDNSIAWPIFAAQDGGFQLYPFARAGATCSNNITPRPFSSVMEGQLPLYFAEVQNGTIRIDSEESIYTLWIGTNDVSCNALLTGEGVPGATLVNTTECAVDWVKVLYDHGARNFLFQNVSVVMRSNADKHQLTPPLQLIPLQKTILYSVDSYPNGYWSEQRNTTEWNIFMTEMVSASNALSKALLKILAPTLPGAHVGEITCVSGGHIDLHRHKLQGYSTPTHSSRTC